MTDTERCCLCSTRFRADDSIGTWAGGEVVHSRCLPKPPRFTDAELDDDDDAVNAA